MVFVKALDMEVPVRALGSAAEFTLWMKSQSKEDETPPDASDSPSQKKSKKDDAIVKKTLINQIYRVGEKLGAGAFGDIYSGIDVTTETKVAIKLEKDTCASPQVLFEGALYSIVSGHRAVPKCHWAGHQGVYNIMVLDVLGPSLDDLFCFCKRRFSLKTVLMVGQQMFKVIEYMHSLNYLHRDIKPNNFLMGLGEMREVVYVIDFGLAKRYHDPELDEHIPEKDGKGLVGTAKFASINSHLGIELSRRDDLEAIGYMLVYFLRGSLPWQGLGARTTKLQMHSQILQKKQETSTENLCRIAPKEFITFFHYVQNLPFADSPDYKYVRSLFKEVWKHHKYVLDFVFDWTEKADIKKVTGGRFSLISNSSLSGHTMKSKAMIVEEVSPVPMLPRKKLWLARDVPFQNAFLPGSFVRCRNSNMKGSVISEFLGALLVRWKLSKLESIINKVDIDETIDLKKSDNDGSHSATNSSAILASTSSVSVPILKNPKQLRRLGGMDPSKKRKHIEVKVLARSRTRRRSFAWSSWNKCWGIGHKNPDMDLADIMTEFHDGDTTVKSMI